VLADGAQHPLGHGVKRLAAGVAPRGDKIRPLLGSEARESPEIPLNQARVLKKRDIHRRGDGLRRHLRPLKRACEDAARGQRLQRLRARGRLAQPVPV
jgi:hypothetical protein